MKLQLAGVTLSTDGSIVYVDGMDLGQILAVALPGVDDRKYEGQKHYRGAFTLTLEPTERS